MVRVFALSDIHVDYAVNAKWITQLSTVEYTHDILILAGDLSHRLRDIEITLVHLEKRFKKVLFVPGNHDIWVKPSSKTTSIEKFTQVCSLANDIGVATTPASFGNLTIIPLLSWYDYSFGNPSEKLKNAWADYIACSWPSEMTNPEVTEYFLEKNNQHLNIKNHQIITFSHFLPRIDVMPIYIPNKHRYIYPVLGTEKLDHQIRKLNANIHIYGHSHVNRNIQIDGIRYINNAFAYPNEVRIAAKELLCIYTE